MSCSAWPPRPASKRSEPRRILLRIAAGHDLQRRAFEAGVLGRDLELLDLAAVRQPQRPRLAVQRDLVEPRAVDHQRFLDAHRVERLGDPPKHLRIGNAEQLYRRPRRIDARAKQVHHRADRQLPPHQRRMLHARMVGGREQEAEAGLVEQFARRRGGQRRSSRQAPRARRPSRSAS